MKKVLLVATVQSHIAQFHKPLIQWLEESGYQVDVAARNNLALKPNLHLDVKGNIYDIPFERSPFSPKNLKAYFALKKVITTGNYDVIHCNTPVGGILTRLAANAKRKKGEVKVIYEAHGFHFFKGGPLKNWLLWYPVEKLCAYFTDVLITINREDYFLAQKKIKAPKVEYVPGVGVDLCRFNSNFDGNDALRKELGIPQNAKVLLSIGELNKNKNHELVIRAIKGLDAYYIIAGNGALHDYLLDTANELEMADRVKLLGYRRDIKEICNMSDVYIFPSFREGLSVSVMEAMACGLPVVCSKIRGNTDLIDEHGGRLFDPHSVDDCTDAINEVLSEDLKLFGSYNMEKVKEFSVEKICVKMQEIYRELLNNAK